MEPINVDNINRDTNENNERYNDGMTLNEMLRNNDEIEIDEGDDNDEPKQSRKKSIAWQHFVRIDPIEGEGGKEAKGSKGGKGGKGQEPYAKCKYCGQAMKCDSKKNGTGGLLNHLRHHCPTSPLSLKKGDMKKQSTLSFKPVGKGEGTSLATHSYSYEKCKRALARMCIKDNRPFSIVDDEGFREFSWEMNPLFKVPSRWTIARECMKVFNEEAAIVKKMLKNQTVSLTTDTWSSVQNINYMCLTAHWVNDEWVLVKKLLNFCPITNHKGVTIGKLVYECLQEWGIDHVFTVTVDNASSNDGAIRYLKTMLKGPNAILDCNYLHLRCCAHIINLVVRDGLEEHDMSISRIRHAVRYIRSSPARGAKFRECVEKVNIECKKKPSLDVETRWNSTYLMLESALRYKDAFKRLEDIDSNFTNYFYVGGDEQLEVEGSTRKRKRKERVSQPPDVDDWKTATQFVEYLKVFCDVTNLISGSKYVTSNLFFGQLVEMHASISLMCMDEDAGKKKMALAMKEKYDKYWDNMNNMNFLLYVAVILDPRNKLQFLGYLVSQIYGDNSLKAKEISERAAKTLNDFFDHYKMKAGNVNLGKKTPSSSRDGSSFVNLVGKVNIEANFKKYLQEQGGVVDKSEVEKYLSDGLESREEESFDVLKWWKLNSTKYPILSQIARHVLAMPISTVASESAFSTGGRVIDPFRSSLTPKTAEALICTQDWIRDKPLDLELPDMYAKAMAEIQDKLEELELDEFGGQPKFFEPCMVDDE